MVRCIKRLVGTVHTNPLLDWYIPPGPSGTPWYGESWFFQLTAICIQVIFGGTLPLEPYS